MTRVTVWRKTNQSMVLEENTLIPGWRGCWNTRRQVNRELMNLYVRPFDCTNEQTSISFHLQASCAPLPALAPPRPTLTRRGISGVVAPPPLPPLPPEYEFHIDYNEKEIWSGKKKRLFEQTNKQTNKQTNDRSKD